MEYVFGLTEGRHAVVYDEGNMIMIAFFNRGRTVNWGVLERDYHSELTAIQHENRIYVAYITISNAIAWFEIGGEGKVLLYANGDAAYEMGNLCLTVIGDTPVLLYAYMKAAENMYRLHYVCPLGDRKSRLLSEQEDKFVFRADTFAGETLLAVTFSGKGTVLYRITDGTEGIYEAKPVHLRNRETEEALLNRAKKEQKKLCEEYEKRISMLENEKEEQTKQFEKQYGELSEFSGKLQEEGRKWRDLYYQCAKNTSGKS